VKISNELKVGLTIIGATVIFILGVRYFEDLPLFATTYELKAEFEDAGGLIPGNLVRVSGVSVGSVNSVVISQETGKVEIGFHVDRNIIVTEGSYAIVTGIDALGAVRLDLFLGSPSAPQIPEGGLVDPGKGSDLLGDLSASAPEMFDKVSGVLDGLDSVLAEAGTMLSQPESDLRRTMSSMESAVAELDALLASERGRVDSIMSNVESVTGSLDSAMGKDGEKVSQVMNHLGTTLTTLDAELARLSSVSDNLNVLLQKLNEGQGTLGLLINDPTMYHKMDSTLDSINSLLADFESDPAKYLGEMKLVDLF